MKIVTRRANVAHGGKSNILCLTVDRLNSDCLGAYGATWLDTPGFDALAADSILFDSYYATSLDLTELFRAFWFGEAPYCARGDERLSLFGALKAQGFRNYLISDVDAVALNPEIDGDELEARLLLDPIDAQSPAETLEETAFFKQFAELARFISKLDDETRRSHEPWCVWAHLSGWNERWDFPKEMRKRFQEDEEDPEPYAEITPPYWRREPTCERHRRAARRETGEDDAGNVGTPPSERARLDALDEDDRRQSVLEAYAAGIVAFDETLAGFLELLKERKILSKTLLLLSGARGCPLGAPSALGVPGQGELGSPFYTEETRAPLVIRLPDATGATLRLPTLCDPRDVYATIKEWSNFATTLKSEEFWRLERVEVSPFAGVWSGDARAEEDATPNDERSTPTRVEPLTDAPGANLLELLADETRALRERELIVAKDADSRERALVTQEWFLKRTPITNGAEQSEKLELFKLPDDRFCVNDVADRCRQEVEELTVNL